MRIPKPIAGPNASTLAQQELLMLSRNAHLQHGVCCSVWSKRRCDCRRDRRCAAAMARTSEAQLRFKLRRGIRQGRSGAER